MAFPTDPLPIKQELLINGVWTDVTSRTRGSDEINITRGYTSEQANLSAAQCFFTLNNRDGLFSNRNPTSTYYKQIGRNVQYRVSVTETTPWLPFRDYSVTSTGVYDLASVSTADKAVLDVVGDLDVRIDVEPDDWRSGAGRILAGKYARTGNQRSWCLMINPAGYLVFTWTTAGTSASRITATSTVQVPAGGRSALRATIDVDNGASGWTVTFYTAATISGTYTALGAAVTGTGVTSIYSSSALLEIANIDNAGKADVFADTYNFVGRVYSFEMRNGIGGTLVAKMDATSRTPGDMLWSDGLTTPNTWQTAASAPVINSDFRFWGEVSKLPQRWDLTGRDVWVPVQAGDLVQRLTQGVKPLESPVFRNLIQLTPEGYWPMESGAVDGSAFSSWSGRAAQLVAGNFGTDTSFPGTAGVLTFTDDTGYASAVTGGTTAGTGVTTALIYFKLPSIPVADQPVINFYHTGGNVYRVTIVITSIGYTINIIDINGFSLYTDSSSYGTGASPTGWVAMQVRLTTVALNTSVYWQWYGINNSVSYIGTNSSFVGTTGTIKSWISYAYSGKGGTSIAHVLTAKKDIGFNTVNFIGSTNGYVGENVAERARRLSQEQGVPLWIVGNSSDAENETMGAQGTSTYIDLMTECAELCGGLLYSPRDKFGLAIRLPSSIRNQGSVALSYTAKHFSGSLEPEEDDSLIRNDVTVNRPNGGFGRAVKLSGALNINDPTSSPDAVGLYDTAITLNAQTDTRLPALAAREVFLGTWDELRYSKVQVELERAPFVASATLTRAVRGLDIGDPFIISGLPKWLPPEDVELLIIGYQETLKNRGQRLIFNTRPYGPFRVNDLTSSALSHYRAGASNSSVGTAMNTTVTTMSVSTPTGKLWGTTALRPGNFPLDVMVAGERMTVTAITGTTSPQTFTVTRSVNGVVKSHLVAEEVQVFDKFFAAI